MTDKPENVVDLDDCRKPSAGKRHRWSEPVRFQRKTERACLKCDIIKVTRHEPNNVWIEFWRGPERLHVGSTPECVSVEAIEI
jgi:hypothetical protein